MKCFFIFYLLFLFSILIQGTQLLNKSVQEVAGALMHHETPASWNKLWDGPEDPVQWLKAIMQKTNALSVWLEKVKAGSLLSGVLDLSELFHPDTFLNAFRQQTARYNVLNIFVYYLKITYEKF